MSSNAEETSMSRRITPQYHTAESSKIKVLIHELDEARDLLQRLWAVYFDGKDSSDELEKEILDVIEIQRDYRQDELDRLAAVFATNVKMHRDKLKEVLAADPAKPLAEQLSFNPSDF